MKLDAKVIDFPLYLVFELDDLRLALSLPAVDKVTHMVHVTPLPGAPDIVPGIVNLRGRVIPVINMRRRLNLRERETALSDRLVFARTRRRSVALVVDDVIGVVEGAEGLVSADAVLPAIPYVSGIIRSDDGLILIHDLDRFLDLEEEETLDAALAPV